MKFIYDHLQYSFDIKFQYDLYEYSLSKSQSSAISSVPKVFFKDDLGNWNEYNWKESGDFLLDDASKITFKIDWTSGRFEQNGDLRGGVSKNILESNSDSSYTFILSDIGGESVMTSSGVSNRATIVIPVKIKEYSVFASSLSSNIQIKESTQSILYGEPAEIEFYSKTKDVEYFVEIDGVSVLPEDYVSIMRNDQTGITRITISEVKNNYNITIYEN